MSFDIKDKITELATQTGSQAAKDLADLVQDANRLPYLDALATKFLKYRGMAIAASDATSVEFWTEKAAHTAQTMKHVLVQERIAADDAIASMIKRALVGVATGFCMVAKELVAMVAQGLVKGAVEGLKDMADG